MKKTSIKTKLLFMLPVAVFLLFTLTIYGPLGLYLPNAQELWFSLRDVLMSIGAVSGILFVILIVIALLLPSKISVLFTKLVFGLALGFYIQGNLMNISYGNGVMDGTAIHWEHYTKYAVVNTAVWCFCIALPFVLPLVLKRIGKGKTEASKVIVVIALFLTAVQIPALLVNFLNFQPNEANLTISRDGIYDLSDKENVIIFVLDTMDEAYYQKFLEEYPEYTENLNGFVHYGNTLTSGARTMMAIPSMFTGVPFRKEAVYSEYIQNAWEGKNSLSTLHEKGIDVRVYSEPLFFSEDTADYIENFKRGQETIGSFETFVQKLYKLTFSRFAPHLLKKYFWFATEEFSEAKSLVDEYQLNDPVFFQGYEDQLYHYTDQYDRALRIYHLRGAHTPYTVSKEGKKEKKTTREEQVAGNFYVINLMLEDLKQSGHYDSSLIIITADHGEKDQAQQPIFLMKEIGAQGSYSDSNLPISLFDLPVILYEYAGVAYDEQEYGASLSELSEDMVRERHFFRNTSDSSHVVIAEYMTTATADDYDALTLVNSYEDERGVDTPYYLNTELTFSADATANRYGVEGFASNTGFATSVRGPYAKMVIPVADVPESGELAVHIGVHAVTNERDVIILANGNEVYRSRIEKSLKGVGMNFTVPVDFLKDADGVLTLEMEFPEIDEAQMENPVEGREKTMSVDTFVISYDAEE